MAKMVTITGVFADKYGRALIAGSMMGELTEGVGPGSPPPDKPPGQPPTIWPDPGPLPPLGGGGGGGPGNGKPPEITTPPVKWKSLWAGPEHGWVVVGIIDPSVEHPVPSQ